MKTITIGRDSSCDIVVNNPRVSRTHGVITLQSNGYVYKDNSANGTTINGVLLKNGEMSIKIGDSIMLALNEPISWNRITKLLPMDSNIHSSGAPMSSPSSPSPSTLSSNQEVPSILNQWSWGGFCFGWLWAVNQRIYWPLIVLIPFVGWFALIIVNIMLGINGNKWAWEKESWESVETFERVQYSWAKTAAILVITMLAYSILIFIGSLVFAGGLLSMLA